MLARSRRWKRGARESDRASPLVTAPPLLPLSDMTAPVETSIVAGRTGRRYLRDLWQYRELFLFLAWRDLLVRYKQTVVGIAWALFRPLLTMFVLTFVFRRLG